MRATLSISFVSSRALHFTYLSTNLNILAKLVLIFIDFLNGGIVFPLGKGGILSNKWTTISAAGRPLAKLIACEASPETKDNIMDKIISYKLLQVASFLFVKTFVKPT